MERRLRRRWITSFSALSSCFLPRPRKPYSTNFWMLMRSRRARLQREKQTVFDLGGRRRLQFDKKTATRFCAANPDNCPASRPRLGPTRDGRCPRPFLESRTRHSMVRLGAKVGGGSDQFPLFSVLLLFSASRRSFGVVRRCGSALRFPCRCGSCIPMAEIHKSSHPSLGACNK